MVIPCMVSVEDDGDSKTPGRIYAGSCDGDGGQMNQEHRKSNGERSQNLQLQEEIIKARIDNQLQFMPSFWNR